MQSTIPSSSGHARQLEELQSRAILQPDSAISHPNLEIAMMTRYFEIVGFGISLIALLISLLIFTHFKTLRNSRTNIHCNLFFTMTIQVIIRLIVYIDQIIIKYIPNLNVRGINETPFFCQAVFILLEYTISSMFMWMYVEGMFLHNMVTMNKMQEWTAPILFVGIGWGLPTVWTALWATATAIQYKKDEIGCWHGYNFLQEYWILQAPRLAVIVINFIFLSNIMRVLVTQLNATENSEITKVKKAVRAALLLLPLLGITNIFNMADPVDQAVWKFALWCYVNRFLCSFQGFILSLTYCFMNGEVILVIRKKYRDWQAERDDLKQSCQAWRASRPTTHNSAGTRANAYPDLQSCMEEIRIEQNILFTSSI